MVGVNRCHVSGDSVSFAEQGFRMAHKGGKVHGKFVVQGLELSEECLTHAVDVKYDGLVPVLLSVSSSDGLALTYFSGGHQNKACV